MMEEINLNDFSSTNPRIKYTCAKQSIIVSQEKPGQLYPDIDFFIELLDSSNNIIKWTAIRVIGNLSKADREDKISFILPRLLDFLRCGKLITVNNTILALTEIAKNKSEHSDRIMNELLKIEDYRLETPGCTNIAIGKTLIAFNKLKGLIPDKRKIIPFIEKQKNNPRDATRKKALMLCKKIFK
ncbi:MAG: hypothetical protein PHI72_08275 [Atribacterota bacterium]|jgi:hypothetical protein|nr:hypothetical protein [Atribacterota bacterium]